MRGFRLLWVLIASLVLLHDMSFIERRSQDTRQYMVVFIAVQAKNTGTRAAEGAGESATDPALATHREAGCASDAGGCDGGGD